jgi:hypothetical protein
VPLSSHGMEYWQFAEVVASAVYAQLSRFHGAGDPNNPRVEGFPSCGNIRRLSPRRPGPGAVHEG